jgi:uncharacterized membrane protein YdjX (TVP38/TMEM64 family)
MPTGRERLAKIGPFIVLAALIALGIALDALGLFDWRTVLEWARGYPAGWELAVAIIVLQVGLFTFALPGSSLVWVAAVLYPPPLATLILTSGGTGGALFAYLFSHRLTRVTAEQAQDGRLYRLLKAQSDFLTLIALRVLPGMPHSLINYAAGTLRLPLPRFLVTTALGLGLKAFLYSSAIDEIVGLAALSDVLRVEILAPLFAIALLLLLGSAARKRWLRARGD